MLTLRKRGLIYGPSGESSWAKHSALQPTPYLLDTATIRIFTGFRDSDGVSRVGFVDVSADDPSNVISVSKTPSLDIGPDGAFDENGVAPCAILVFEHRLYLYYAGYQLGQKVRFCAYSGLAVSDDHGVTFKRLSNVPVTDRTDDAMYFRVIHSIMNDNGIFKVWYGAGSSYDVGADKTLPRYNVQMMESKSLFDFPKHGQVVVETKDDEYRVGRPYVFKNDNQFIMFYGTGSEAVPYRLGYATSIDSYSWQRKDDLSIEGSSATWDSEMMAYPAVVTNKDVSYLFYNGNNYGREGFGYAVIEGL